MGTLDRTAVMLAAMMGGVGGASSIYGLRRGHGKSRAPKRSREMRRYDTLGGMWGSTTYFPPKKRNGAKECARRIKQGLTPSCYVHDYQYPYYRQLLARCKREAAAMDHMV